MLEPNTSLAARKKAIFSGHLLILIIDQAPQERDYILVKIVVLPHNGLLVSYVFLKLTFDSSAWSMLV